MELLLIESSVVPNKAKGFLPLCAAAHKKIVMIKMSFDGRHKTVFIDSSIETFQFGFGIGCEPIEILSLAGWLASSMPCAWAGDVKVYAEIESFFHGAEGFVERDNLTFYGLGRCFTL